MAVPMGVTVPPSLLARKDAAARRAAEARRRLAAAAGRYYRPHFTDDQLRALTAYKNAGADRSYSYKYVMAPLYDRLIALVPPSLAPNAVTLIGFALIIVSHLVLVAYAPKLEEKAPPWVYFFVGGSLFTYMVLDNLDGRQARRTGSSSPLGHLFDHGCDAFNVTVSGISFVAMLRLGPNIVSYALIFFSGHLICFAASLEELFTGAMILREINGPNEGLILMSLFHIATGFLGADFWLTPRTFLGVTLPTNAWIPVWMSIPAVLTVAGNVVSVVRFSRARGISTSAALARVVSASFSFVVFGTALVSWAVFAPAPFADAVLPILWLSGVNFFYMISRMIIAHLTSTPYPTVLVATLPQALCAVNAVVGVRIRGAPLLPQAPLLVLVCAGTAAFNAWRIYCMVLQICDYLNIRCLHLGPLRLNEDEPGFHGDYHRHGNCQPILPPASTVIDSWVKSNAPLAAAVKARVQSVVPAQAHVHLQALREQAARAQAPLARVVRTPPSIPRRSSRLRSRTAAAGAASSAGAATAVEVS